MKKILSLVGLVSISVLLSACTAVVTPGPGGRTVCRYHPNHAAYHCHWRPNNPNRPWRPHHPWHPWHPWHPHRRWR